jgi:hypothetical protein
LLKLLLRWWYARDTERRIRKHGWTGIYVGDYSSSPTWVYTVGLEETLGQPELVIFDLPNDAANNILWRAYEELKQGDLVLEDGKAWLTGEAEHPIVWRKVHPTQIESADGWFTLAVMRAFARTGRMFELEAFQLVLSDQEGRLPWEPGYDDGLRFRQPALYLPATDYGEEPLSPPEREALRIADEAGWSIMRVPAGPAEWAYTIGLVDTGKPELIAFLPADGAAKILQDAQARIASGDLVLKDGLRWNDLGFECCWRKVDESQYLALSVMRLTKLRHARRLGRREALEAYQLFVPDAAGRYAWEPGCAKGVRDSQPLLFEPFDLTAAKSGPLAALTRM